MILVPIGHDQARLRRKPVATLAIIAVTLVVFVVVRSMERDGATRLEQAGSEMLELWLQDPGLAVRPEVRELLPDAAPVFEAYGRMAEGVPRPERDPAAAAELQSRFDRAQESFVEARRAMPSYRFGHVPSRGGWVTLVTYIFLHGGAMHLLGNMFFFWLAGIALEDVWGRLFMPGFYLAGGVLAGLAHALAAPGSSMPLIGASGAVAALMGAYCVRFSHSRIRFWYFFGFIGTFGARAIVVLPIWLGQQMLYAMLLPDAPVAFTAHVGGFLAGAAGAAAVGRSGVEARWLAPAVDRAAAGGIDPALARARELLAGGDAARAELVFLDILGRDPADLEALRGLCATARADARLELLADRLALLLRNVVRAGGDEEAGAVLAELRECAPAARPRPEEWLVAARALDLAHHPIAAGEYERFAASYPRHPQAGQALLRAAGLGRRAGEDEARIRELLAAALAARPGDPEWRRQVERLAGA